MEGSAEMKGLFEGQSWEWREGREMAPSEMRRWRGDCRDRGELRELKDEKGGEMCRV